MTNKGRLFIIDLILEQTKDRVELRDFAFNPETSNLIADAKLEPLYNTLVFRTVSNDFFWVQNVVAGLQALPQPSEFKQIPRFTDVDSDVEIEFLVLPRQESQSKKVELFVTDPTEGFHLVKENLSHIYYRDQRKLTDYEEDEFSDGELSKPKPFGKVKYMALNAKKDMVAMYCESEKTGHMFVMKANMQRLLSSKDTEKHASSLCWSGNDCPVLSVYNSLVIVGPQDYQVKYLDARTPGIFLMNENDGLRVLTSEHSYFFECVKPATVNTFRLSSTDPAKKLHEAQKYIDYNNPCAD